MKYRPCFLSGVCALMAVGTCVFLHNEIAWILTAAGIILAAAFLWIYRKEDRKNILLCSFASLCCILSFSLAYIHEYRGAIQYAGSMQEVTGYVIEQMPDSYQGEDRWLIQANTINRQSPDCPVFIALTVKNQEKLAIGNTLHCYVKPVRYSGTIYSELSRGIYLKGVLDAESMTKHLTDADTSFSLFSAQQQQKLRQTAERHLNLSSSGIFCGMLYGDKYGLEDEILLDFKYSGFAHLLAVSGLHIQVIAVLICSLLTKLFWFYKGRAGLARGLSLVVIWSFIVLIGCPISAVRSGIMISVAMMGYFLRKRSDTLNSLGFSVVLILILMPFSICSLGFWMSVLATFGIGFFGEAFNRCFKQWSDRNLATYRENMEKQLKEQIKQNPQQATVIRKEYLKKRRKHGRKIMMVGRIMRMFMPGIAATLGLLPIYFFCFGYLPVGAVLIGPLLSFLFNGIVLCGIFFTGFTLAGLEPAVAICAKILQPLLALINQIVGWTAARPALVIPLRWQFAVVFFVIFVIGLFLLQKEIRVKLLHIQKTMSIVLFLGLFFALGLLFTQYYQYNIVEITAIGGYQNKDIVLISGNKASVFICDDVSDNGQELLAYLKRRGVWQIENICIMVPTNGIPESVAALQHLMPAKQIFYNSYGLPGGYDMAPLSTQEVFTTGKVQMDFRYSQGSLNAMIQCGDHKMVLLQDLSLAKKEGFAEEKSDVVFLYHPIGEEDAEVFETSCLILLSDIPVPSVIDSGKTIYCSEEAVTIELDSQGNISLP